jgi:hypothetical protein
MSRCLLRTIVLSTGMASACAMAIAAPPAPLLPAHFAGWAETAAPQMGTAPETADAANADVLREYGLQDFASATYASGKQTLTLHAFRFADATGAYGAFTFYCQPQMKTVNLGKGGAEAGGHFLLWTGATVIDATFGAGAKPAGSALQTLAAGLRQPPGPEGVPPSLPHYLPPGALEPGSVHYSTGPVAYTRGGGVLPADVVRFDQDAEALTAQYDAHGGKGTLTLLMYPTPQMAGGRMQAIDVLLKNGSIHGNAASLQERRSGPLLAITSGDFTQEEAQHLLDQVKFAGYVTVDRPQGYISEAAKTAKLLVGIATLTVVLGGAAILLGLFFGGGRAMIRVLRGKPPSSLSDEQFITLHLSGEQTISGSSGSTKH